MGTGFHGGFGNTQGAKEESETGSWKFVAQDEVRVLDAMSDIDINVKEMKADYPVTEAGYFGIAGKRVRIILSDTPKATSEDFYQRIGKGGVVQLLSNGHGSMTKFEDNTLIVYRPITSTPDSPAVEITTGDSTYLKSQKIHFIRKES